MFQVHEPMHVTAFIPESAVEAFNGDLIGSSAL